MRRRAESDSTPNQSPRGRGRPRVEARLERVSTRLPVAQFDRLVQLANQKDTSVSNLLRQIVVFRLS